MDRGLAHVAAHERRDRRAGERFHLHAARRPPNSTFDEFLEETGLDHTMFSRASSESSEKVRQHFRFKLSIYPPKKFSPISTFMKRSQMSATRRMTLLLSIGAVLGSLSSQAQTSVTTQPVGVVQIVCKPNTDTVVGTPLSKAPFFVGSVASDATVSGSVATFALGGSPGFTTNGLAALYFLKFKSGPWAGRYYTISANSPTTISFDTLGEAVPTGMTGAQIAVVKYWTLGDLFPAATQTTFALSSGTLSFQRGTELLIPDTTSDGINLAPNQIFFVTSTGWKSTSSGFPDATNQVLYPDTYFIIRHPSTVSSSTVFTSVGDVNTDPISVPIFSVQSARQDNPVVLQRPIDLRLDQLGLESVFEASTGTLTFQRKDELLVFDNSATGVRKSPSRIFFRVGANWVESITGFPVSNSVVLPAGTGFLVRRAAASNTSTTYFTNTIAIQ